jgi:hypothetical protein
MKLAYPTTRPFQHSVTKTTAYKVNRNTKFYKTLLDFRLSQLPIVEIIVESYCYYTGKSFNFKGTVNELMNDFDAYSCARRLVECEDRYSEGPLTISDWKNGNMVSMFFSHGESSNDKFIIVWETV